MVVDGGRAQEQLRGDVPVAVSLAGQPGDLRLLRRELLGGLGGPLAGSLAGGQQLDRARSANASAPIAVNISCAMRSCSRAFAAAALAAQPFAVHQVSAGELRSGPALPQVPDGLGVELLGIVVAASSARDRASSPSASGVPTAAARSASARAERGLGHPGLAAAPRGLNQVGQHLSAHVGDIVLVDVKGPRSAAW